MRPSELTDLTWDEVDFNDSIIRIKVNRMKMNRDHLVLMSTQVQNILLELSEIETGSNFVFPTPRNKNESISTDSLLGAIRNLGVDKEQFTTHGFRHMASTRLNELEFRSVM
nr:tyrosine-type recombinase/integrase [Candidatus Ruthia endofausta]